MREVQRSPSPDAQLAFITQLEREAHSRASRSIMSRNSLSRSSNSKRETGSDNTNTQNKFELNFNPRHLERFEKIRGKQKRKFYSRIKM